MGLCNRCGIRYDNFFSAECPVCNLRKDIKLVLKKMKRKEKRKEKETVKSYFNYGEEVDLG